MKRTLPLFFFPLFFFPLTVKAQSVPDGNGIVYVKKGNSGNGSSWSNARGELADALLDARTNASIKQIWVAFGNYLPLYRADDEGFGNPTTIPSARAFLMVKDVKIYGGFQGNETSIDQRLIQSYPTILDGEQGNTNQRSDNCIHVVVAAGDIGTAELNGFYVQGGYARTSLTPWYNGISTIGPIGGGLMIWNSSPRVENCVFWGNVASYGGGIYMQNSNTTLINCTIAGNQSVAYGGGLYIDNPQYTGEGVINCTIACNAGAAHSGYSFYNNPGIPIRNTIIWNNIIYGSNLVGNGSNIKNSLVQSAGPDPVNNNIGDVDPQFGSWRPPAEAPFIGGDYRISVSTSPVIDKGDNHFFPGLDANSRDGNGQRRSFTVNGKGNIDIGATEYVGVHIQPDANGVVYVKKGGTGDGSSWNSPLDEPAHPIVAANSTGAIKEVWIAKGTYYPLYRDGNFITIDPHERNNTFWITRNIKIYGGFAGTEQNIEERSFKNRDNETILSGDYYQNDQVIFQSNTPLFIYTAENVFNIIKIQSGSVNAVTLDGLTITGAIQSAIYAPALNTNAGIQLHNLIIRNNNAASSPVLVNDGNILVNHCRFDSNRAGMKGGALSSSRGSLTILNSVFTKNFSAATGGAVFHFNNNCKIVNCTMISNFTPSNVSNAIFSDYSGTQKTLEIDNSIIFTNNPAYGESAQIVSTNNITTANESIIQMIPGSSSPVAGNWISNNTVNILSPNLRPQLNGDAYNTGNTQAYLAAGGNITDTDIEGNSRIYGTTIDIGAFEFTQQSQSISVADMTKTYGDAAFEATSTVSSNLPLVFTSADYEVVDIFQDATDGNKYKFKVKKAGTATIVVVQDGNDEYLPAPHKTFTLTVNPKALNIAANPVTITYGNVQPNLTYQTNGLVDQDNISGELSRAPGNNAGTYSISIGTLDAGSNYTTTFTPADFTIKPKSLSITPAGVSKIYGDADPVLTYSSEGLLNNDALSGELNRASGEQAGNYTITTGTLTAGNNYTISLQPASLTITPKDLFLTAGSYERPYGEANPALTIQYNGFIAAEGPADITPPAIATTALPGSDPGDYPVTLSGGSATNYTLKPTNGTLKVTGAVVNLQQQPENIARCAGNTGSFSVSANAPSPLVNLHYQWQRSDNNTTWQNINGAQSSTLNAVNSAAHYRCIITAPGTTITSDAATFTINTAAIPVIQVADKVCIDDAVLALQASPAGGQFSGNAISNNVWDLEEVSPGKQTILYQYTDENGCIGKTSKEITLHSCGNFGSIINAQVYPNPTPGPVTIKLLVGVADNWFINISNQQGQSVWQQKFVFREGWNTINLSTAHLPSGIYTISFGRGGLWKHSMQLIKK